MELTAGEEVHLKEMEQRLRRLRAYLIDQPTPNHKSLLEEWFAFLAAMKEITGNPSNNLSFVATLMAKRFLCAEHSMRPFDVAAKPQNAPGLDIDEYTVQGERVVGEIKTTTPQLARGLGGNQKKHFANDFDKLRRAETTHKYFFVTDRSTFDVLRRRYAPALSGVTVVLLPANEQLRSDRLDYDIP